MYLEKNERHLNNRQDLDRLRIAAHQNTAEREYWERKMAGEPVSVHFPYDKKKSGNDDRLMDTVEFKITGTPFDRMMQISNGKDNTQYMLQVAALKVLLKKYNSAEDDIIVGAPILRQEHTGRFINTVLALRDRVTREMTVKELLRQVRTTIIEANKHQNYPVELLANNLEQPGSGGTTNFFDIAIQLQNIQDKEYIAHVPLNMQFTFNRKTDHIEGKLEYNTRRYRRTTAERIAAQYSRVLEEAFRNIDAKIADIDIYSDREKEQFLNDFNAGQHTYTGHKTIHGLFEEQVQKTPDNIALTAPGNRQLSYRCLNRQANRLAHYLAAEGIRTGDIAAIKVKRSIEMIIGLLGILKTGAAYLPINPKTPAPRIRYLLKDSTAKLLLTAEQIREITENTGAPEQSNRNRPPTPAETQAYIIYTSGSTGTPKGVPITHQNYSPLIHWGYENLEIGVGDRVIQNLSYYFDWSVWEIFIALTTGAALHMITEDQQLTPRDQVDDMLRHGITVLHATPTQNRYLLNEEKKLDTLRYLCLGAEKLTADQVRRSIGAVNENCRILNMYGPTEATIIAAVQEIDRGSLERYNELTSVPIGKAVGNIRLQVLDENLSHTPINAEGELYIAGDAVAGGYLNNPELTAEKFILQENRPPQPRRNTIYKTGDRVRRHEDGTVEFLGRVDHQVKIRGYRIEPGEIENRLQKHDTVKDVLVTARKNRDGENTLYAYIVPQAEAENEFSVSALRAHISVELPDYMVPAHFISLKSIPQTPNGKVDHKALPDPETGNGGTEYAPPRNGVEEKLTAIWAEALGMNKETVGIDHNFFQLGGHSLKANSVTAKIYRQLEVKIPLNDIFKYPTVRKLAATIKQAQRKEYKSIEPAEKKDYYILTAPQKRLYILQQMEPENTGYNMPYVLPLQENVDPEKLETAIKHLIHRHEILRTSFRLVNEHPFQVIRETADITVQRYDIRSRAGEIEKAAAEILREFVKPFDLAGAPLLRLGLIRTGEKSHRLLLDMHHIITDGTTQGLLAAQLMALYRGETLPPVKLQYKDYAEWLNTPEQMKQQEEQEKYWRDTLNGQLPTLNLPIDYTRPVMQSFEGGRINFALTDEETARIKQMADENNATMYMTVLAIFSIQLAKLSREEDIIVGTPIAGRRHPDQQELIGMLVNTLAMRSRPQGEKTFREYLAEIRQNTLNAYENQDYPFDRLVEELDVQRDTGRNPVFDVMFNYLNQQNTAEVAALLDKTGTCEYENITAKFDLNLAAVGHDGKLQFNLEYCTKLFKKETAEKLITYFKRIAARVVADPEQRLADIELLSEDEKTNVLSQSQGDAETNQGEPTIHRQLESVAARHPEKTALVMEGRRMTYAELNKKSNQLARRLRDHGVVTDTVVGLMTPRSFEMVVGITAILKAGGGYMPIDPDFPQDRVNYMLKDSRVPVLLTAGSGVEIAAAVPRGTEVLDIGNEDIFRGGDGNLEHETQGHHALYVLYTSGSTGRPKGVMLEHRNLLNLMHYQYKHTGIDFGSVLQFTTISFDVSFQEIYGTLLAGGELHLISKETRDNIPELFRTVRENNIKTLFLATGFLKFVFTTPEYIEIFPTGIDHLVTAGEQLIVNPELRRYLIANNVKLHNHYGPTEAHVVTALTIDPNEEIPQYPTIGRPLTNTGIYIVDKYGKLQPDGLTGELCIGGVQVGRGYLNNPELTAEKFIKNPHIPTSRLYKSGDLARWQPDGTIEYQGRVDYQVKIRGFRIELEEIENRLMQHPGVTEAVVTAREDRPGDKYLCAYYTAGGDVSDARLKEYLTGTLPGYMVPQYILHQEEFPRTASGKVARKALPQPDHDAETAKTTPRDEVEKALAVIWAEALGIEPGNTGIDDNFFDQGGHSLKATLLAAKIHREFSVKMPLAEIFKTPTIKALAERIRKDAKENFTAIQPVEKKEYYPLSSAQKRLFILEEIGSAGVVYNMPAAWIIEGNLDEEKFFGAFKALIDRHESFRTSFKTIKGKPAQIIHRHVDFKVEFRSPNPAYSEEETVRDAVTTYITPFDLEKAPLIRVSLMKLAERRHLLLFDMHHIITDGISQGLMVSEFMALYKNETLPPLNIQYKDFAEWQTKGTGKKIQVQQEAYWLDQFKDNIPVLELPTDNPRPDVLSSEGDDVKYRLKETQLEKLRQLTKETQTTLNIVLLAIYIIQLSKYSGQDDIVVGQAIAARTHSDLEKIIGFFVNFLAVRNRLKKDDTFADILDRVKENTLAAYENQDYQFDDLVSRLNIPNDLSRNPLFNVSFVVQNMEVDKLEFNDIKMTPALMERTQSRFDMQLEGWETKDSLTMALEYSTTLFKKSTAEKFLERYIDMLDQVVDNINIPLEDIRFAHDMTVAKSSVIQAADTEFDF